MNEEINRLNHGRLQVDALPMLFISIWDNPQQNSSLQKRAHLLVKEAMTLPELALWKANLDRWEWGIEGDVRTTRRQNKSARREARHQRSKLLLVQVFHQECFAVSLDAWKLVWDFSGKRSTNTLAKETLRYAGVHRWWRWIWTSPQFVLSSQEIFAVLFDYMLFGMIDFYVPLHQPTCMQVIKVSVR